MDLRSTQQPLKDGYRADPSSAQITLRASGSPADAPIACSVDLGRAIYEAQAHEGVGGAGTAACSGDLLLGALAACAQLTCQMVATAMGIETNDIQVFVEGDLDLRGTLGLACEVTAGFNAIRIRYEIDAPTATPEQVASLQTKTERYCTVLQTLSNPPPIDTELRRTEPRAQIVEHAPGDRCGRRDAPVSPQGAVARSEPGRRFGRLTLIH